VDFIPRFGEPQRVRPCCTADIDNSRWGLWQDSREKLLGPFELQTKEAEAETRLFWETVVVRQNFRWRGEVAIRALHSVSG